MKAIMMKKRKNRQKMKRGKNQSQNQCCQEHKLLLKLSAQKLKWQKKSTPWFQKWRKLEVSHYLPRRGTVDSLQ